MLLLSCIVNYLLCLLFRIVLDLLLRQHVELNRSFWLNAVTWRLSLLLANVKQVTALYYDFALGEDLLLLHRLLKIRVWALSRCERVLHYLSLYIRLSRKIGLITIGVHYSLEVILLADLIQYRASYHSWLYALHVQISSSQVLVHDLCLLLYHLVVLLLLLLWSLWIHKLRE